MMRDLVLAFRGSHRTSVGIGYPSCDLHSKSVNYLVSKVNYSARKLVGFTARIYCVGADDLDLGMAPG